MSDDLIVLRASSSKWMWVLIGSLVFVTLGLGLTFGARTGVIANVIGAVIAIVFAFCSIVAIGQIRNPGSLVIHDGTIEVTRNGRLTTYEFADCSRFTPWRNPSKGSVSVVFDYAPDEDNELNQTNRRVMGGSRAITDNYGMMPNDLAMLLNNRRAAAQAGGADGPVVEP